MRQWLLLVVGVIFVFYFVEGSVRRVRVEPMYWSCVSGRGRQGKDTKGYLTGSRSGGLTGGKTRAGRSESVLVANVGGWCSLYFYLRWTVQCADVNWMPLSNSLPTSVGLGACMGPRDVPVSSELLIREVKDIHDPFLSLIVFVPFGRMRGGRCLAPSSFPLIVF